MALPLSRCGTLRQDAPCAECLVLRHRLGCDACRRAWTCAACRRCRRHRDPGLSAAGVPQPAPLCAGAVRGAVRYWHAGRGAGGASIGPVPDGMATRCQLRRILPGVDHAARCVGDQSAGASLRSASGGATTRSPLRRADRWWACVWHHAVIRRDRPAGCDGDARQYARSRWWLRRASRDPLTTHVVGDLSRLLRDELLESDQHHDGCRLHRGAGGADTAAAAARVCRVDWHGGDRMGGGPIVRCAVANTRRSAAGHDRVTGQSTCALSRSLCS